MKQLNEYVLYEPLKSGNASAIPETQGCYLIVLRPNAEFVVCKRIAITPKFTTIEYSGETLKVVYVGAAKNLREEYENHFLGKTGNNSTFWKSIGCLMGYTLYQGDISSAKGALSKFSVSAEKSIKKWIIENLLFLYSAGEQQCTEAEMIAAYNPPLNLLKNSNEANSQYRKKLSELRNKPAAKARTFKRTQHNEPQKETSPFVNTQPKLFDPNRFLQSQQQNGQRVFCPHCGSNLRIPDVLINEKELTCLICYKSFPNPLYNSPDRKVSKKSHKKFFITAAIVALLIAILANLDTTTNTNSDTYRQGAVRYYLKKNLKDPESYQSIDWNTVQHEGKTYVKHKYRAKNSFGGYVIEEKIFKFDESGNITDIMN